MGGFATMPKSRHQEISRRGARAAIASGKSHRWTKGSDEVRRAGQESGRVRRAMSMISKVAVLRLLAQWLRQHPQDCRCVLCVETRALFARIPKAPVVRP